jgi:hypothetical protein
MRPANPISQARLSYKPPITQYCPQPLPVFEEETHVFATKAPGQEIAEETCATKHYSSTRRPLMLLNTKFLFSIVRLNTYLRAALAIAAIATSVTGAHAALIISTAPTKNVNCTGTLCEQTQGGGAVLNVTQLENLLASSDVEVSDENRGGIIVQAPITWVSASKLTLRGESLKINKSITITGTGGLTLLTVGNARPFTMGPKAKITFWTTSSSFAFGPNATPYTLVNSIAALASAVAENPSGNYALANDYDASADGTYASSPILSFAGSFFGLNHTISNLSIADTISGHEVGLFGEYTGETISYLNLQKIHVSGTDDSQVGGIAGISGNRSIISNVSVEGTVSTGKGTNGASPEAMAGVIVGLLTATGHTTATLQYAFSIGKVRGGKNSIIGGAVGEVYQDSGSFSGLAAVYSTASVTLLSSDCKGCVVGSPMDSAGGLIGANYGIVGAAYAMGAVTGGSSSNLGGLVGFNSTSVADAVAESYSTGTVIGGPGSSIGGSVGFNQAPGSFTHIYWDTTTSGITDPSRGVGNVSNASGVTGLTTAQLQSGLPAGFSTSDWGEKPTINGGLPYLLVLPPK